VRTSCKGNVNLLCLVSDIFRQGVWNQRGVGDFENKQCCYDEVKKLLSYKLSPTVYRKQYLSWAWQRPPNEHLSWLLLTDRNKHDAVFRRLRNLTNRTVMYVSLGKPIYWSDASFFKEFTLISALQF